MPPSAKPISVQKIKRATLERDSLHTPLSIWRHNSHTARCKSSPRLLASGLCPPQPVCRPSLLNSLLTKKLINNLILFPYINITACKTLVNLIKFIRYYLCKLICWIIVRKSATKNCLVQRRMLWNLVPLRATSSESVSCVGLNNFRGVRSYKPPQTNSQKGF